MTSSRKSSNILAHGHRCFSTNVDSVAAQRQYRVRNDSPESSVGRKSQDAPQAPDITECRSSRSSLSTPCGCVHCGVWRITAKQAAQLGLPRHLVFGLLAIPHAAHPALSCAALVLYQFQQAPVLVMCGCRPERIDGSVPGSILAHVGRPR
jgi:hypothetical protein